MNFDIKGISVNDFYMCINSE